MTVTYKGPQPTSRRGTDGIDGIRRYTRSFIFESSSDSEDEYAILSHPSAPQNGSVHPSDAGAFVVSRTAECTDGRNGWLLTCEYSSERQYSEDPTADPAAISWTSEQFQKPAIQDKDGDAIVNSAGDPFDPPNMMDDSRRIVTVTKNLATVPAWILTYQDAVNSDAFTVDGVPVTAGQAKMQRVDVGEVQSRNGINFRPVVFQIHLQRDGWLLEPLDAGFRELDGTARVNIANDGDGGQPAAPVPLDGSGGVLANPDAANCVFLSFSVYNTAAFAALPLT